MKRIRPITKDYAWGSREALPRLAGRETPSSEPEAELWVGAHEAGPSLLDLDGHECGLDAHISSDFAHHLGSRSRERFGDRLPFLLKILAAEKALSIQAHPDEERAAQAPEGVYGDAWAKPEAWVPLVESEAFAGSLPFPEVDARLRALEVSALDELLDGAREAAVPETHLLTSILRHDEETRAQFVADVVAAVRRVVDTATPAADGGARDDQMRALRTVLEVHDDFEGDIGVVVLLTMRHHLMTPGSSYFIGAGVLHSFVKGTTVEILANSDNVVRGGLTPKKMDVDELLAIVDVHTQVAAAQPLEVESSGESRVLRYPSRVPHFVLWEVRPGREPVELPSHGQPSLLMALDAPVTLACDDDTMVLDRLECAWWAAGDPAVRVTGEAGSRVFLATLND